MILKLPDIRQRADYDCGLAAVDCALSFIGVRTAAVFLGMANPVQGTSPDTVEAMLRRAGCRVLAGEMSLDDLQHFANQSRPVLCPVALHGGHWVVSAGVQRGVVHFHDPLDGALKMKAAAWMDGWRDGTKNGHEYKHWGIAVW